MESSSSTETIVNIEFYDDVPNVEVEEVAVKTSQVERKESIESNELPQEDNFGKTDIVTMISAAKKTLMRSESSLDDMKISKSQFAKSKIPNRRPIESKSIVSTQQSKLKNVDSRTSISSTMSKSSLSQKNAMFLAHPLGKMPKYLTRFKEDNNESQPPGRASLTSMRTRLISSSPSETPTMMNDSDHTRKELMAVNGKLIESKRQIADLKKTVDQLRKELAEKEILLTESDKKLKKESETCKSVHNQLLTYKRGIKKTDTNNQETANLLASQKEEIENLNKAKEEFKKKISSKEELVDKLNRKVAQLERDVSKKVQCIGTLEGELSQQRQQLAMPPCDQADNTRVKLERKIVELEKKLKVNEIEINSLKGQIDSLADENVGAIETF